MNDDLRPDYDLAQLKGGVLGKYYRQAVASTNLVLIEPELANVSRYPVRELSAAAAGRHRTKQQPSGHLVAAECQTSGSSGRLERRGRLAARRSADGNHGNGLVKHVR
jgi:hypothetical protein